MEGEIGVMLKCIIILMILGMVMMMSFGFIDIFFVSLLGIDLLVVISFIFFVMFIVISLNIGLGIGMFVIIGKL